MRTAEYQRQAKARIARLEAEANAAILRAFDRVIQGLQRELTEYRIHLDRKQKRVRR